MHNLRIGLLAMVAVCILFNLVGCKTLALTGEKKYKVDVSNAVLNIKAEFEKNGDVDDAKIAKLENLLEQYREEFGTKGSFKWASDALTDLKEAKADPANSFREFQNAVSNCDQALEMLKTEVKD